MVYTSPFLDSTFGDPLTILPPKVEEVCPDDGCTVVQTVMPISGTCAEISVPRHVHRNKDRYNCDSCF